MDDRSISGQIYNVGSTQRISILELADRVRAKTQSRSELVFVPYEEVYGLGIEDTLHREPAIGKIRAADRLAAVARPRPHPLRRGRARARRAGDRAGRARRPALTRPGGEAVAWVSRG